jgi:hypothetical protein
MLVRIAQTNNTLVSTSARNLGAVLMVGLITIVNADAAQTLAGFNGQVKLKHVLFVHS